jgi:hypothetical protein
MKLQIGDEVIVIRSGEGYSNWVEMANLMGLSNFQKDYYVDNQLQGTIVALREHPQFKGTIVAGLQLTTGVSCLITTQGLKLLSRSASSFPIQLYPLT